jgi:ubiquinone/menaquinone biosynthesis C-methylase UbiE
MIPAMKDNTSTKVPQAEAYARLIDPLLAPLRQRIVDICKRHGANCVLDICSATGEQCILLGRAGIRAVGVDLSEGMVEFARTKKPDTVEFFQQSALDLDFEADSFDCVILSMALHEHPHKEQHRMVEEALRVLRPDGVLVLAEYASPKGFRARLVWLLIYLIERFAGREHFRNFRQFVRAGGTESLKREFALSVLERHRFYYSTIEMEELSVGKP